jgi:hypothetical protein
MRSNANFVFMKKLKQSTSFIGRKDSGNKLKYLLLYLLSKKPYNCRHCEEERRSNLS